MTSGYWTSSIGKDFPKPVYFVSSQFYGQADFSHTKFQSRANFSLAKVQGLRFSPTAFKGEADFSGATFHRLYGSLELLSNLEQTSFQLLSNLGGKLLCS